MTLIKSIYLIFKKIGQIRLICEQPKVAICVPLSNHEI